MENRCYGMEGRNLRMESYRCPRCGEKVELFSDETGARCQKCAQRVTRETAVPYIMPPEKGSEG
ncbi:MAG: hypothetical protein ABIB93_03050 [Chloroflexota bacterium]